MPYEKPRLSEDREMRLSSMIATIGAVVAVGVIVFILAFSLMNGVSEIDGNFIPSPR